MVGELRLQMAVLRTQRVSQLGSKSEVRSDVHHRVVERAGELVEVVRDCESPFRMYVKKR